MDHSHAPRRLTSSSSAASPATTSNNPPPPPPPLPPAAAAAAAANNPANKRGVFARFVSQPFTAYGSRPASAQTGRDGTGKAAYQHRLPGYVQNLLSDGWPGFRLFYRHMAVRSISSRPPPTAPITERSILTDVATYAGSIRSRPKVPA